MTAATDTKLTLTATAPHVAELLGATAELTVLVDPSQKVVYASQTSMSLLGHDPLHIVGHQVSELVHPQHAAPLSGAINQVLGGAILGEAELRFPHNSGAGSLPLSVGFARLAKDGVTEGVMITARHLTTRQAVEAFLVGDDAGVRSLGEKSPVVLFTLDDRGRCTWINNAWPALTGQPSPEASGLGWLKMVEESDRDGFRSTAAQAHKRQAGWRQQFRVRTTEDAVRWFDGASAPRLAANGTVDGYVVVFADITADVRARGEVNKRTTIVESNAAYVVMDDRNQRIVHGSEPSAPLAQTPPVPATNDEPVRPSLGALPSATQSQYINEIRPSVLADGVWTAGTPATSTAGSSADSSSPALSAPPTPEPAALAPATAVPASTSASEAEVHAPLPSPVHVPANATAAQQALPKPGEPNSGQPLAWSFDTPLESADSNAPVQGWTSPSWQSADPEPAGETVNTAPAKEAVYVGLVGPSGEVESIAAVSEQVLEPTEFENIVDQLPAMDTVTGLANRALFQERIRLAMNRMHKDGVSVAVMLANLHGYADVRRQVGPKTGDDQLFVISKRLEGTIRQADTAARIGDEDFAVLGVGWFFPGDVENAAKRFIVKIQEPLPSVGGQLTLPASMGIAIAQPDEPIAMILRRAQRARKMAWELGAGRVYVDHGPGKEPTKA